MSTKITQSFHMHKLLKIRRFFNSEEKNMTNSLIRGRTILSNIILENRNKKINCFGKMMRVLNA